MFGEIIELDPHRNQRQRITTALQKLLQRTNEDSFVVFQDPESGSFVQFATLTGRLMLDLPFAALKESEEERAVTFFKALGERLGQNPVSGSGENQSFQVFFGTNVEEASAMTYGIFELVFCLPPAFLIDIEEN